MSSGRVKICRIPEDILYHPSLRREDKLFLGLAWSFAGGGLRLSNAELGKIICLHPGNVSLMIARLEKAGWIEITAGNSRRRLIYLRAGAKVDSPLTFAQNGSTFAPAQANLRAGAKQNIKQKRETRLRSVDTAAAGTKNNPRGYQPSAAEQRAKEQLERERAAGIIVPSLAATLKTKAAQ